MQEKDNLSILGETRETGDVGETNTMSLFISNLIKSSHEKYLYHAIRILPSSSILPSL